MAALSEFHYRYVLDELHKLNRFLAEAQTELGDSVELWMLRTVLSTATVAVAEMTEANATHALKASDWATLLQFFTKR